MKTILVIEDEQSIRANLLRILELNQFQAVGAENGAIGVQLAKAYLPDLIICDILMPHLNGYGVLAELRQDPQTAMIPLIFLSAKIDRSDIRQGMNLGADDYLTKPFTSAELLAAVAARIEKQLTITQPYQDEIKRAAESLSKAAYCDPLTDLPNRIVLCHRLQAALEQAPHPETTSVAVFWLNINRFREVNTGLGHAIGDLLLQTVAQRLSACGSTHSTVARMGGDEFGLFLAAIEQEQDIIDFAQSVLAAISFPYHLSDREVHIQVSMGIACYTKDGHDPDILLTHAATAARWCHKQTSNGYQFYNPRMDALDAERQQLEASLTTALAQSELQLYYQPQVNLMTGRIMGMEALLRWQHPQQGLMTPDAFLSVAEELGLILAIEEWALHTACAQIQEWQSLSLVPLHVSVNLSARQFRQRNLTEIIAQVLQQTGLDPKRLVLELTECSVMEDVEATIATLKALKALGVEISIDDFGTGLSSLSYLHRFAIDTLKIGQSFIRNVTDSAQDAAIATAIIAIAQSLKLKVVAKGVETEAELAFLRQHGCQAIQGHLYSPAVPASEVEQLLVTDRRLPHTK
jgi:diguanylate cyclase (GGDEF)-like protein